MGQSSELGPEGRTDTLPAWFFQTVSKHQRRLLTQEGPPQLL